MVPISSPAGQVIAFPQRTAEGYVDLHELRARFGFSERWWRYRIREGLPKHRYGGHWRFLLSEVESWLHERERHAS